MITAVDTNILLDLLIPEAMRTSFPVGKLPHAYLDAILRRVRIADERVVVGPRVGEDAAVIDMGERFLIVKSDPITLASERIGWYAVNVNANDVAVMGGRPRWFLATLLLPEGKADEAMVKAIFDDILATCDELGIMLCGGHTEITYNLDRPIIVGHMLGEASKDRLVTKDKIRVGDKIVLTKGIAIEGTAIIARERAAELCEKLSPEIVERAKNFLHDPSISVVREALLACEVADISAMHDPTEGGLLAALYELGVAGDVGLLIEADRVNVFEETALICEALNLDPFGLIASGALLIAVKPEDVKRLLASLSEAGIAASVIGEVRPRSQGMRIQREDQTESIVPPSADEITKTL